MPNLFLLEHDPDIRFILHTYLAHEGYDVLLFSLIDPLIQAMQNMIPDLILLDYYVLQIYKSELLPRTLKINFHYPNKIFLLSTSDPHPSVMNDSLVDGVIAKPFDLSEVSRLVKAAIM